MFIAALAPALHAEDIKVDINKASVQELAQLKNVGPGYAQRIVEHREQNGAFEKPEDIMKVKGIGQKTWELNKDRITVEKKK
ncbi:MAG: helix-hairpin-helix domain-containing protein [Deltaproteobacteria bacterium]|nr:helix-hairpin-helix domain-containing protein [Deltaproteobacteria bacterium]